MNGLKFWRRADQASDQPTVSVLNGISIQIRGGDCREPELHNWRRLSSH